MRGHPSFDFKSKLRKNFRTTCASTELEESRLYPFPLSKWIVEVAGGRGGAGKRGPDHQSEEKKVPDFVSPNLQGEKTSRKG